MLILPIKGQWFNMILFGDKKEEYREIKPFYTTRFINEGLLSPLGKHRSTDKKVMITLRNGYGKKVPSAVVECSLKVKKGYPEWGAEPNILYYALYIERIVSIHDGKKETYHNPMA